MKASWSTADLGGMITFVLVAGKTKDKRLQ